MLQVLFSWVVTDLFSALELIKSFWHMWLHQNSQNSHRWTRVNREFAFFIWCNFGRLILKVSLNQSKRFRCTRTWNRRLCFFRQTRINQQCNSLVSVILASQPQQSLPCCGECALWSKSWRLQNLTSSAQIWINYAILSRFGFTVKFLLFPTKLGKVCWTTFFIFVDGGNKLTNQFF